MRLNSTPVVEYTRTVRTPEERHRIVSGRLIFENGLTPQAHPNYFAGHGSFKASLINTADIAAGVPIILEGPLF